MKLTNVSTAICLIVWSITLSSGYPEKQSNKIWARYYPLAIGNSWKYSVVGESGKAQAKNVVWKVVNSSTNSVGPIFGGWRREFRLLMALQQSSVAYGVL